jgi:phenylpropionate dioxygenase-like ring-hydroxylating dioxygenase large terminal subunit
MGHSRAMRARAPDEDRDERLDETGRYRIVRLRDHWYVACRSRALRSKPLALTMFDTPMVLYRRASGAPAALLDRCAHRNVPLSLGAVDGDRIACRYHGWRFDADGVCRHVPALCGPQESRTRRVPAFPTVETQGFVWVWPHAERPPRGEPFHFPHLEDASYESFRIDYRVEGTLHAVLENMLDVPHTAFLHRGLFRGGAPNRITAIIRRADEGVEAEYVGEPRPSGIAARVLGTGADSAEPLAHFDRFFLPSISQVEYRLGPSHFVATSALTPESDFVTRFSTVITYRLPLPRFVLRLLFEPVARRILAQDAWIVREQTRAVRRFEGEEYTSTGVDVLGAEIWRLLKRAAGREWSAQADDGPMAAAGDEISERRIDLLV